MHFSFMDGLELRFKKIGDGGAWSYITYRCLESFDPDIPTSKSIGSTSFKECTKFDICPAKVS